MSTGVCGIVLFAAVAQERVSAQSPPAFAAMAETLKRKPEKNKGDFTQNNERIWSALLSTCGNVTEACANAAVYAASNECEASAKFFKKGTTGWQTVSLVLSIASAAFTGVGASTTLANAKVFSTLGGTTGLSAVGATLNANVAGDQAGLASVNSTLSGLQKFLLGSGTPPVLPSSSAVFTQARLYGAACAAAANASPANDSSKTPSTKPTS